MVTNLDTVVHCAAIRLAVVGAEDVVDAHVDMVLAEAPPEATAGGDEAVGEVLCEACVGVGNWALVEVAADDDALPVTVVGDVAGHGVDLRAPQT